MTRTPLAGLAALLLGGLALAQPPAAPAPKMTGKDDPDPASGSWRLPPSFVLYARQPPDTARFEVQVPAEAAEVWVEGKRTATTGVTREYQSPRLVGNKSFTYKITAKWTEDRRQVEQSVDVYFTAGDRVRVVFPLPPKPGAKEKAPDPAPAPKPET